MPRKDADADPTWVPSTSLKRPFDHLDGGPQRNQCMVHISGSSRERERESSKREKQHVCIDHLAPDDAKIAF